MFFVTPLVVLAILDIFGSAHGDDTCNYPDHRTVNASGIVPLPGFQPFINAAGLTNSTWFISTSIKQERSFDTYSIEQDFWLDSRPFIAASPEELPYTGCAILLTGFPANRTSSNPNNKTESCNGLLDEDCRSAITGTINSLIGRRTPQFTPDPCESIISTPPSQCKGFSWSGVKSAKAFGDPLFSTNTNASCRSSVFNGTQNLISIATDTGSTTPLNDNTTYDNWVKRSTPLVLAVWSKDIYQNIRTRPDWGQSAVVCVTPNMIETGSRAPISNASGIWSHQYDSWLLLFGILISACM